MTARNERARRLSAEREGRGGVEDLGEAERRRAKGDGRESGGGLDHDPAQGFPDTHDLENSAVLSLFTAIWFVLLTFALSGRLPVGTYLVLAGLGYVSLFVFGFLLGRQGSAPDSDRAWVQAAFGCRLTVLLIMGGLMLHGMIGGGDAGRAWWEPPVLWVPAVLLPAIAVGGALDGDLLGQFARGLPRRAPWHALRFIVSARRRAVAERTQQETGS